jgi:hypothetical protein
MLLIERPKLTDEALAELEEKNRLQREKEKWLKMITPYGGDKELLSQERGQYLCSRPRVLADILDSTWT